MTRESLPQPLAILGISDRGARLAARIRVHLGGDVIVPERSRSNAGPGAQPFPERSTAASLRNIFGRYRAIVLVMPVGAAVRLIAPVIVHKRSDPAAVVLDEAAAHAVSLLSGHLGRGNELTRQVALAVGARPVITTAAELFDSIALDVLGRDWDWRIELDSGLTRASAALVAGEPIGVVQEVGEDTWWPRVPSNVQRYGSLGDLRDAKVAARLVISDRVFPVPEIGAVPVLYRPRSLVVGVGCVQGASADEIEALVLRMLADHGLSAASVRELATIDRKRDEPGIVALGERRGWALRFYSAAELAETRAPSGGSDAVEAVVGTPGVCEPAALRAAGAIVLLVPKTKTNRVTAAIARVPSEASAGHLAVVGIGPGGVEDVTARARAALEGADAIVGYHGYLDLVRAWLPDAALHGSPIGDEVERCRLAIQLYRQGKRVALASSGDPGVYGTAGIVFELLVTEGDAEGAGDVEVIPGVTAAAAAAALLGAPLMCDFAAISLSDLMTPWPVIEARLEGAAASDLVVALYNPASEQRREQLARAKDILLSHRPSETPVGLVRNASRPGQTMLVTDLGSLRVDQVDMLTTVIVGNRSTIRVGNRIVTRRGYQTAEAPLRVDAWGAPEPAR